MQIAESFPFAAFISPYSKDRVRARSIVGDDRFIEIYLNTPLNVCEKRDPKNLYQLARSGKITEFTGVSAPYEQPSNPKLVIDTSVADLETCLARIVKFLEEKGLLLFQNSHENE